MRVFNLTDQRVDYKGRTLPPYGSEEFDLSFIPDRDRGLEKAKILAFGALPKNWHRPKPPPEPVPAKMVAERTPEKTVQVWAAEKLEVAEEAKVEPKVEEKQEFFKKNKKY